jgi:hypothetical protein
MPFQNELRLTFKRTAIERQTNCDCHLNSTSFPKRVNAHFRGFHGFRDTVRPAAQSPNAQLFLLFRQ